MTIFLDTNVLVAAVVQKHVHHARSFGVLDRVQMGKDEGYIGAHSLAEMYSVLTSLASMSRHTPEQAILSIEENVLKYFKVSVLNATDYAAMLREAALTGIQGGTIYDAVLLKSAAKAGVDRIYTLNLKHFQAVATKEMISRFFAP